jgi:hypothetical protein
MFKRITWFTVGAVVGAGGTVVGYLKARDAARELLPDSVQDATARIARTADSGARVVARLTSDAIGEWRDTAGDAKRTRRQTEQILRGQLERSGL